MYEYIKILLVEDEAPLLGAMTLKLKKAGFTVLQGHNGREGLDIAMKEFPNIIITDIVMPEMDGLQMIQNIRQDQNWGISVPIILLTNLNDFNHVATAMEYGVHDYLVKSNWKLKDLLETVKNKLNLNNREGAPAQATEQVANPATVSQPEPAPTTITGTAPATPAATPTAVEPPAAINPTPINQEPINSVPSSPAPVATPVDPNIAQPNPAQPGINPAPVANATPTAPTGESNGNPNNYYS